MRHSARGERLCEVGSSRPNCSSVCRRNREQISNEALIRQHSLFLRFSCRDIICFNLAISRVRSAICADRLDMPCPGMTNVGKQSHHLGLHTTRFLLSSPFPRPVRQALSFCNALCVLRSLRLGLLSTWVLSPFCITFRCRIHHFA
jgi:hypothetical protein